MAIEISRARRAKSPEEEFESLSLRDAAGVDFRAFDLRIKNGDLQVKLDDEGQIAWFSMEKSDRLFVAGDVKEGDKSEGQTKTIPHLASKLTREMIVNCSDGSILKVLNAARSKKSLRVDVLNEATGKFASRLLQPSDSICEKPKQESKNASASLGDAIRLKIAESLAATASVPQDSAPKVAYRPRGLQGGFQEWKEMPVKTPDFEPEKRSRVKVLALYAATLIPIVVCGLFIYHEYLFYNPGMELPTGPNGDVIYPGTQQINERVRAQQEGQPAPSLTADGTASTTPTVREPGTLNATGAPGQVYLASVRQRHIPI